MDPLVDLGVVFFLEDIFLFLKQHGKSVFFDIFIKPGYIRVHSDSEGVEFFHRCDQKLLFLIIKVPCCVDELKGVPRHSGQVMSPCLFFLVSLGFKLILHLAHQINGQM